ncbi:MAG: hypothetical protein J6J23_05040 [Clostridia bacterium]|nr:hypothetical protein [Clostridia bacterium]
MAEAIEKKFLGTAGVERLVENIRTEISEGDTSTLDEAKTYADGLADNYDAAGTAATKMQELADGQVKTNKEDIEKLNGDEDTEGSVKKAVKDAKDEVEGEIGALESLETTDKDNIVDAINEVRRSVSAGGTAAAVSISTDATSEGASKSYTIYQGETKVGVIDIPKDMVVESGEVVVNPEGQAAGTYIKLVLANATNDVIYVNVGTLVDIYKAQANATQIQLAIDSATREISATVVAGSITATELAANAITTEKIANGNVTKEKLSTAVQTSLEKADNADANAQAKADAALEAAKKYTDDAIGDVDLSGIATNAGDIDKLEASLAEGGATANAIADAKQAGTDAQTAVTNLTNGEVANLRTDVNDLKAVTYTEITTAEIDAMFAS